MTASPSSTPIQQTRVDPPIDFQLMLELWNAGPASRDAALEMADRNRVNARSERK